MINFKVVKADGFNRYIIKRRFLFFFWKRVDKNTYYTSQGAAAICCRAMNLAGA